MIDDYLKLFLQTRSGLDALSKQQDFLRQRQDLIQVWTTPSTQQYLPQNVGNFLFDVSHGSNFKSIDSIISSSVIHNSLEATAKNLRIFEANQNRIFALHGSLSVPRRLEPKPEEVVENPPYSSATDRLPQKIALPPGYWMERVSTWLFFFAPKTIDRVFGETIADYRHEMIKAEATGRPRNWLRFQHWSGFILAVGLELVNSTLGKLARIFIKG